MALNTNSIVSTATAISKAIAIRERKGSRRMSNGTAKAMLDRQRNEPPPHITERDDRIAADHLAFWGCDDRECALAHSRKPLPTAKTIRSTGGLIGWIKRLWRDR